MQEKVWECSIGGPIPHGLPSGADLPMRIAIGRAFKAITGVEAQFTFSGWGGTLTEWQRAVVEERELNDTVLRKEFQAQLDHAHACGFRLDATLHQQHPLLGLATTKQLKDELAARGPDSPDDYRTVDG